jgi:hypothetical protein
MNRKFAVVVIALLFVVAPAFAEDCGAYCENRALELAEERDVDYAAAWFAGCMYGCTLVPT